MIKKIIQLTLSFFVLVFVQVLILNNIRLGGYINPYLYVLFILFLPLEIPNWFLLLLAFVLGLAIDMFSNTMGMHAAASVFMAFCRPQVLRIISPRDGYESGKSPTISTMGLNWFFAYSSILVVLHHIALFYIEVFRFSEFFPTLGRVLLSSILTIALILISQYLFYKTKTEK